MQYLIKTTSETGTRKALKDQWHNVYNLEIIVNDHWTSSTLVLRQNVIEFIFKPMLYCLIRFPLTMDASPCQYIPFVLINLRLHDLPDILKHW